MGPAKTQHVIDWVMRVSAAAILATGVVFGAIVRHIAELGIVAQNGGGPLFGLALFVFAGSAVAPWIRRNEIPRIGAGL